MSSHTFALQLRTDPYAQRRDWTEQPALEAFVQRVWHAMPGRRWLAVARVKRFVGQVHAAGERLARMDAAARARELAELRTALRREGFRDDLSARAFALVRAASQATLGLTHFDSQVRGAYVLLSGRIAEMNTGEGKTLTATLAAATAGLAGLPVHVVTVNDYLAERDCEKLAPLYAALGLRTGLVTEEMDDGQRAIAYRQDIVYCSNKTVVFDYLRDRNRLGARMKPLAMTLDALVQGKSGTGSGTTTMRGLHFAIVDEADSVFIDEARTPLILSATKGGAEAEAFFRQAIDLARALELPAHALVRADTARVELTEAGRERLDTLAKDLPPVWHATLRRNETVQQALGALHVYQRDVHYIVRDDKVLIVDENTGRVMADRSWERGLHQMIEIKEGAKVSGERETLARISYQLFFRRYVRLAGMTGTGREVASEMSSVYGLDAERIPTRLPSRRTKRASQVLATADAKWDAVTASILRCRAAGQPVLVGTRSVLASEALSARLSARGIAHQVLNAKQDAEEAQVVEQAGRSGCVTIATSMAGRGTDIALPPESLAAGGLHVILTERHDNARVDRQLAGRCARQGDPGSWESILSMEDDVVRELWPRVTGPLRAWMQRRPGARLPQLLGLACQRLAQRRIEHEHARVRSGLLKADFENRQSLSFTGQME